MDLHGIVLILIEAVITVLMMMIPTIKGNDCIKEGHSCHPDGHRVICCKGVCRQRVSWNEGYCTKES